MQDRPTAEELLDAVAELLESQVMGAVGGPLRHQVRVAANLCRILQREARLGESSSAREQALLSELLPDLGDADLPTLNAELARRLATGGDAELERRAWTALVEISRGKLAIDKPGHDAWDFRAELA